MKAVGNSIKKVLMTHNLWNGYQQYLLVQSWPDIVGEKMSEVSNADRVINSTMYVIVKDSVWAHHLSFMKRDIINKINAYAGSNVVNDIYFKIGELDKS